MSMTVFFLILIIVFLAAVAAVEWARAEYWHSQYKASLEPIEPLDLLYNLRRNNPDVELWFEEAGS